MRVRVVLLAALLASSLASLAPPAGAQTLAPAQVLEDAAGDHGLVTADQHVPDSAGWGALDLLGLSLTESKDLLTLVLEVQDVTSGGKSAHTFQSHSVLFTADDTPYRVLFFNQADESQGWLTRGSADGSWYAVERLYPVTDPATNTYTVDVPRESLLNSQGAAPQPGWRLSDLWAESRSFQISGCCQIMGTEVPVPDSRYGDRMPDTGSAPLPYEVQLGLAQTGHAFLQSDAPTRSSNGEASTFVFDVRGHNLGTSKDTFELALKGVPTHWDVALPTPVVEIGGGGNQSIPVVVTIPFVHKHGSFESFIVEMESISDPSAVGRIELGIRYTEIPQPTGHHDTLWFHSSNDGLSEFETAFGAVFAFDGSQAYMNAAEEDPVDTDAPVPAWRMYRTDPGQQEFMWRIHLQPSLDMGIDWDLTRTGTIQAPVQTTLPLLGASMEARLFYEGGMVEGPEQRQGARERILLANATTGQPADIDGTHVFTLTVTGTADADFIPWQKDSGMFLELRLTATGPAAPVGPTDTVPRLHGGSMELPLHEYRDPVDDLYSSVQGLVIHAASPQQRMANPGTTVLFLLDLTDHGSGEGTFELTLSGPNEKWASVVGDQTIQVARDGNRRVAVAVEVPDDARDGDVADLVLQVTHRNDPAVRSMARLLVEVDKDTEHPDDTDRVLEMQGLLSTQKDTPGLPLLPTLGLLAGVLVRQRARRRSSPPPA